MTIRAELADGRILEFPEGTDPNVIQSTVKKMIAGQFENQLLQATDVNQQRTPEQQEIVNQSEAKILSLQGDLDRLNQVRANPDTLEQIFGGVEGFLSIASAPIAATVSGLTGLVDALNPLAPQGAGAARQKQVQEALTFTPQLSSGQGAVGNVAGVIQGATDIGTSAIALTTAGIEGAITGDPLQAARTFQDISDRGASEVIGSTVAEKTDSPFLGSIAKIIPEAALSFTGAGQFKTGTLTSKFGNQISKTKKAVDFKKLSATKKQRLIAEEIKSGNPNIDSVTKFITESGKISTSKASRVALKELKEAVGEVKAIETVSVFERMSDASKIQVQKAINIIKKGRSEPLFKLDNRPSDVLGESIGLRAERVFNINKEAGKNIGKIAKALKNKKVNISAARNDFFKSMDELGVKFNVAEDGWVTPDFSRSKFAGGSQKDMNVLTNDLLKGEVGFEFAHELKQSIRQNLNFDPIGTAKITGRSEKILKDLSSQIDGVLDATSKPYNKANIKFAKTKDAVNKFQKMAGKDVDLFSDTAKEVFANKAKRITSNATSRSTIKRDIDEIDAILDDLGKGFNDNVKSLIFATDELERIFDVAPQNSLQGNLLMAGGKLARGDIPLSETAGFVKKLLSPSEKKVFLKKVEVLEDLIKLKVNK